MHINICIYIYYIIYMWSARIAGRPFRFGTTFLVLHICCQICCRIEYYLLSRLPPKKLSKHECSKLQLELRKEPGCPIQGNPWMQDMQNMRDGTLKYHNWLEKMSKCCSKPVISSDDPNMPCINPPTLQWLSVALWHIKSALQNAEQTCACRIFINSCRKIASKSQVFREQQACWSM